MWLLPAHSCHGKFYAEAARGKSIRGCLALPDIISYYWFKLWPHFLLHHPISSCLKSAHHICAYWTFPPFKKKTTKKKNNKQVNQKRMDEYFNFTHCIFFRGDLQHVKHDSIETLLQVGRTLIAERFWAAALLENTPTQNSSARCKKWWLCS